MCFKLEKSKTSWNFFISANVPVEMRRFFCRVYEPGEIQTRLYPLINKFCLPCPRNATCDDLNLPQRCYHVWSAYLDKPNPQIQHIQFVCRESQITGFNHTASSGIRSLMCRLFATLRLQHLICLLEISSLKITLWAKFPLTRFFFCSLLQIQIVSRNVFTK